MGIGSGFVDIGRSFANHFQNGLNKIGLGGLMDFGMTPDSQTVDARSQLMALAQQGQMPVSTVSPDGTFYDRQIPLANRLEQMAQGNGPSAARLQMRESMDRAAGAQGSMARGAAARGVGAGAAFRQAGNNVAAIQTQGARDMALARAQEQLGANALLGSTLQGIRQSNDGAWQFNANAENQMRLAQQQLRLQALSNAAGTGAPPTPGLGMQALGFIGGMASGGMASAGAAGKGGAFGG